MRVITNTSLQGIFLPFITNEGEKVYFLAAKATIKVPEAYQSKIVDTLVKRRILRSRKI